MPEKPFSLTKKVLLDVDTDVWHELQKIYKMLGLKRNMFFDIVFRQIIEQRDSLKANIRIVFTKK